MSLFNSKAENPPLREAIEFYKHAHNWSNRLVAGDSLLVMNSLLEKEGMAGQVQMVYFDPPYGIKYGSNFQPFVNKRDVKDGKDEDLTAEPEMIKAFRDTWELGLHSYLSYLRDRLLLARELLHESGSVFVQISDENVHHVREILDEVFGTKNFVGQICFVKATAQTTELLSSAADYILWYAKDKSKAKYNQLFFEKEVGREGATNYGCLESPDGKTWRRLTQAEKDKPGSIPTDWRVFSMGDLTSQRPPGSFPFEYQGTTFTPGKTYWKTSEAGLQRLAANWPKNLPNWSAASAGMTNRLPKSLPPSTCVSRIQHGRRKRLTNLTITRQWQPGRRTIIWVLRLPTSSRASSTNTAPTT